MARNIIDFFDMNVPGASFCVDYMRRLRNDAETVFKSLKSWKEAEHRVPWLTLEVINTCNSNCIFCAYRYQDKFRTQRGILSDAIFDKAINEYVNMGGKWVSFTPFAGEPLLDPKIIQRVRTAHDKGLWTSMFTNGTRLNKINLEELINSGIDNINISTGPFDEKMYEALYRNGKYDDLLTGLKNLLIARTRLRPELTINMAFRSHVALKTVLNLTDFKTQIKPHLQNTDGVNVNTRGFDNWGGQIKQSDMIGIMRLALPPKLKYRPCVWTFTGLYITWDGQVRACACRYTEAENQNGVDGLYLGHINDNTLEEIWHGKILSELRHSFDHDRMPAVCKNCTMYRAI